MAIRTRRALLLLAMIGPLVPASAEVIDRVLAVVNGRIVTLSDARGAINLDIVQIEGAPDPIGAAVTQLIDRQLMLGEVQRYLPVEPEPAAIEARIEVAKARFRSAAEFEAALVISGLDVPRVREIMRDELRIRRYLDERFATAEQVRDEQIAAYVREHRSELEADGRSEEEVRQLARERLAAERRRAQIAEWLAGLRRRADIVELYLPAVSR